MALGEIYYFVKFSNQQSFFPVDGSGLQSILSKSNPCAWHILGS